MIKKLLLDDGVVVEVKDDGSIYHNGYRMKPYVDKAGYCSITINKHRYLVHRLVASAFIQPLKNGDRKLQVHHKDENKANNCVGNLEVITAHEHQHYHKQKYSLTKKCIVCGKEFTPKKTKRKRAKTCSYECWLQICNEKAKQRQKPIIQLDMDGNVIKHWKSAIEVQNVLGYFESNINKCCRGNLAKYKGFRWEYDNPGYERNLL